VTRLDNADVQDIKRAVREHIVTIAPVLVETSREIHAHPELNFEERFACDLLVRTSGRLGLEVEPGAHESVTGFAGDAGSGPTVCVMSEYDALPGIGHGCGHNVIAAAGLGAAVALAAVADACGGRVRYLGTPAEEGGGGKIVMARNGALEGVDVAMMVHSADADLTTIDAIALQQLEVRYHGRESHAAAAPHMGRNALDAAVLGYMGVAALRQHIRPTERVHGIFTAAGEKPNIVPRESAMEWYVRSDDVTTLAELKDRVLAALGAGAHACGCTMDHAWVGPMYADMVTNSHLSAAYAANAASAGRLVLDPRTSGHRVVGSTDMGNISHLVPSIHPMIACAPTGTAIHTSEFTRHAASAAADAAVVDGALAMALTAVDFWLSEELREDVRREFETAKPDTDVL
jgi:amidohydrolase